MNKIITLVIISMLFMTSTAWARQKVENKDQKAGLVLVIKIFDYNCDYCTEAWFMGNVPRGMKFKVVCNNWRYMYEVVLTPRGRWIVKPW